MTQPLKLPSAFSLAFLVLLFWSYPATASASRLPSVELNDHVASVELWPAVTILRDPEGKFGVDEALAAGTQFVVSPSAYATLGLQQKIVWLRAPITVSTLSDGEWILDID